MSCQQTAVNAERNVTSDENDGVVVEPKLFVALAATIARGIRRETDALERASSARRVLS